MSDWSGVGCDPGKAACEQRPDGSGERVCREERRRQKEQPARGPEGTSTCWRQRPAQLDGLGDVGTQRELGQPTEGFSGRTKDSFWNVLREDGLALTSILAETLGG